MSGFVLASKVPTSNRTDFLSSWNLCSSWECRPLRSMYISDNNYNNNSYELTHLILPTSPKDMCYYKSPLCKILRHREVSSLSKALEVTDPIFFVAFKISLINRL